MYWDFNESIHRPLGGQEVPENGFIFTPRYSIFSGDHGLLVVVVVVVVVVDVVIFYAVFNLPTWLIQI